MALNVGHMESSILLRKTFFHQNMTIFSGQ